MAALLGILGGSLAAFLFPETVLWMKPALQPAFGVTMFFVGTLVHPDQVRAFVRAPGRVVVGVTAQYIIMPCTAFAVSLAFEDPTLRTGIVLVGCMPGAMASNVMTALFEGDLILSVAITTLASLICPLVIALWLPLLADTRIDVHVGGIVLNATWMVVGPMLLGVFVRRARPTLPRSWNHLATGMASAAIVLIIIVVVAANRDRLALAGPSLMAGMLALNLAGYGLGYAVGRGLGWPPPQRKTLVIEIGMQNAGLGSVLALEHLSESGAVPSALYTALCVITASVALPLKGRRGKLAGTSPA